MRDRYLRTINITRDLVKREFKLLVTLLGIVAAVWGFLWLANAVRGGTVQEIDEAILLSLRQPGQVNTPRGPAWLHEIVRDITSLGGGAVITLTTLSVVGFLVLHRRYRSLVLLLIATVGGVAMETALKNLVGRGRPTVVPHLMTAYSLSFPSGHSMMSVVVYLTLAAILVPLLKNRLARIYIVAAALFVSMLIGVSRVYLGVHYPSDVLGGWLLGLAWATLCWMAESYILRMRAERRVDKPIGQ
jgi:undecaprenyl-diphosphatase